VKRPSLPRLRPIREGLYRMATCRLLHGLLCSNWSQPRRSGSLHSHSGDNEVSLDDVRWVIWTNHLLQLIRIQLFDWQQKLWAAIIITWPRVWLWSIVMSMSVCLSVCRCESISQEPHTSTNFLCMLSTVHGHWTALSGDVVIRYVGLLPVFCGWRQSFLEWALWQRFAVV